MHVRQSAALALATLLLAACGSTPDAGPFAGKSADVTAVNVAFDPAEITLPTGVPLRIVLDNQDVGVPHNVRVFTGDQEIAKSPTVSGPATTEVRFGPLAPARYQFTCEVHPNMLGTLIVTP